MKKITAILITVLLAVGLSACSGKSFDLTRNIVVVSRDSASGTREAFETNVGLLGSNKESLLRSGAEEIASTGAVIEKVKTDVQAIGYVSAGLVNEKVKVLKVNGVLPTIENIKNGTYSIQRPFVIVYKEETLTNHIFADFEKFLRSKDSADIIAENGFVTLSGEVGGKIYGADYLAPTTAFAKETINVEGSTSVGPVMEAIAEEYKKLNPNITINVTQNGSSNGLSSVKGGTSNFGMLSKNTDDGEVSKTQIAIDGVAIIVNKKNTFIDITKEQIKGIYIKEGQSLSQINKWDEIK